MVDHNFILLDPSKDLTLPLAGVLTKRHAPEFVPRIGGGDQSESLLDSLKTSTAQGFGGGMFQRRWKEGNKVARSIGVYNESDDTLYPVPSYKPISTGNTTTADGVITAKCVLGDDVYFAGRLNGTNYLQKIRLFGATPAQANIPLPAVLSTILPSLNDITFHADGTNRLHVNGQLKNSAGTMESFLHHRYDYEAGVWSANLGGGFATTFSYNGQYYGVNENGAFYIVQSPHGSVVYTTLEMFESNDVTGQRLVLGSLVFNGAAYIFTRNGLYRFDGVAVRKVTAYLDIEMFEHNGLLYGFKNGWLISFDGTNIRRIHRFFETGDVFVDMCSAGDYLAILTSPNNTSKFVGSDTDGTPNTRIYLYDGVGFSLLHEGSEVQSWQKVAYANGRLVVALAANNTFVTSYVYFDMSKFFLPVDKSHSTLWPLEIVTSDHDGDYPKIAKSYEVVDVEVDNLDPSDVITVSYSYKVDGTWQDFEELTDKKYGRWLIPYVNTKKVVEAIKVKASLNLADGSSASLRSVSIYYTLQPRRRFMWNVSTDNGLEGTTSVVESGNSTQELTANQRYSLIDGFLSSKTPLIFLTGDKSELLATQGVGDTTFSVKGEMPISSLIDNEPKLLAVKNDTGKWEVMHIDFIGIDSEGTNFEVISRGDYGITPGTFSVGNEVRLAYQVTVDQLSADLSDNAEYSVQEVDGLTQQLRSVSFSLIEV